jgi:transposase-like protein
MQLANSTAPHFVNEAKARTFLEMARWPNGPVCPHCGAEGKAYKLTPRAKSKKGSHVRPGLRKCARCRREFTVTVGTIFESSRIPLHKWLHAYRLVCSSKKGVSAHHLHQVLGITYKSAWFMARRIRYTIALIDDRQDAPQAIQPAVQSTEASADVATQRQVSADALQPVA